MVFKVFFVMLDLYAVRSCLVSVPTTPASLPPKEILRMYHTLRDSTTDIKKTYQKGVPSESDLVEV